MARVGVAKPGMAGLGAQPDELSRAVRQAQDGDEDAFRTLYRAVQPGLLRYLRVLVGADAEDVASDTWVQIVRGLGAFRGDYDGFRGWTATIGRNRAMDHLRRLRRQPGLEPAEALLGVAAADDPAAAALESLTTDAAVALIASLPLDQAEAVLLRVVLGLDAKAAAAVLGKRAGAVRVAAHRGLRTLAERLNQPRGVTRSAPPTLREVR
jgi:RNA polymerase sigma-70 factor (ECF subfamily)